MDKAYANNLSGHCFKQRLISLYGVPDRQTIGFSCLQICQTTKKLHDRMVMQLLKFWTAFYALW